MTDDVMKDLVTKHDATISQLVSSVEHLVSSQTETNKKLEEISKYLAKQAVFGTRLDDMDRNLNESFKRVHRRIDEMDAVQKSDGGCNSVRMLQKDIERGLRDLERLESQVLRTRGDVDIMSNVLNSSIKPSTIKWVIGVLIMYSVSIGSFMVTSIFELKAFTKQQNVINKSIVEKIIDVRHDFNMENKR